MAAEGDEPSGDEEATPTPARPHFRLEMGDLPGLQAFFRELNRSLAQQVAASEVFARVVRQQSEYIARVFASSSMLADFNASMAAMVAEVARASIPLDAYQRVAAAAVANALPRDLVVVVPTIDTAVQIGEPLVTVETSGHEILAVRLNVMTTGLIVFWIYFLQGAVEALARGDVDSFKNLLGVAIGCVYALSEYQKRQS